MKQIADQARSFTDLNGLYDCFTKSDAQMDDANWASTRNRISAAHVESGDWWATTGSINKIQTDGAKTAGSFLNSKTDAKGATLCNDVLKDALSVWGYKDGLAFMCSIAIPGQASAGIPRGDGSSCQTGAGTDWNLDGYADDMWAQIKKVIYGGAEPKFADASTNIDAATYLVYRDAFIQGCHPVVSSTATADTKYSNIVIVADDGTSTTQTYEGYSHGTTIDVYRLKGYKNDTESCADIATNVNKYAPKYAAYRIHNTTDTGTPTPVINKDGTSSASTTTSCVIDGVGWIVCSMANFMATVSDGIYSLVENLLKTPIINTDTTSGTNGVYNAWVIMRNIANVAFVVGFLIIIFSQMTSLGVSNYGVKKTLPRLIVAAILVNVSFWISAIAVDLSNILGAGLYDLLSGVKNNMNIGISTNWGNIIGGLLAGGALTVAGTVLVAGAATAVFAAGGGMAILFLAIPLVLSAVLAVLIAALVLIARQALVVILIIISPLAFVALLLPNTEKLFSKWRSALVSMLLMYPIISIVFGGAQIAGLAIMSTAKTGDATSALLAIVVGQTVMVIPFFFIPTLIMKFSGDSLKGLISAATSKGKGLIGGISGAARKEGRGRLGRSMNTMKYGANTPRGIVGRSVRRFGRSLDQVKDQQGNADKYLAHERSSTTRERLATDAAYATGSAAGSADGGRVLTLRAEAAGIAEEDKDAKDAIVQTNMTSTERHTLAMIGSVTLNAGQANETTLSGGAMQRAAIQEQFRAGSYAQQAEILNATGANGALHGFGQTIAGGVTSNGLSSKDPALGGRRLEDISQGNFDYGDAVRQAITEGKYTAEAFAGMNDDARAQAIQIARTAEAAGDASLITALKSSAAGIQNSVEIRGKISGNTTATQQISNLLPPPTP